MPPLPLLDDRRQVFEFYDEVCTRSYASLRSDQRLDHEQNLLKSYIIEVHQPGGTLEPGDRLRFLNRLLEPVKAEAIATREETLFNVRRGDFVVHCDALNDRFWVIHASTPAASTDRFIDEITRSSAAADSVWFHTAAMVELSKKGEFLGFSSEFDPRPLGEETTVGRPDGLIFNLRRLGGSAWSDFEKLLQPGMFSDEIGVSSIRLRFGDDEPNAFALTEVTHSGKFTERGPSFSSHTALIRAALSSYEVQVENIEEELGLVWHAEGERDWLTGRPIGIRFRPYRNFEALIQSLFNGRKPFRLWGLPLQNSDATYSVQSVDLHVGSVLRFDIENGYLRMYLPGESCGNTVTRLLTNIQRHIDARASLTT